VHRLDKDTTGLNGGGEDRPRPPGAGRAVRRPRPHRPAQARLQAIVWGRARRPRAPIDAPLGRHRKSRDKIAVRRDGRPSDHAIGQVLERYPGSDGKENGKPIASLIECRLETGLTHQIRVHMAISAIRCWGPVMPGFRTKAARLPAAAQAPWRVLEDRPCMPTLWHPHPTTGRQLEFHSELPVDLARLRNN